MKWKLLGILSLAFVLRLWGISFGLPYLYHADEPIVVNHALAYGSGDLNPHFFKIPPLTSYLLFLIYGAFFTLGHLTHLIESVGLFEKKFVLDPTAFFFAGRFFLGVLPGVATVAVLEHFLRKAFSQTISLTAAFFLSIAFLHVRDSHYIYADIPLLLTITLALGWFLKMTEDAESLGGHLIAGFLIGLSAAFKYNGAVLLVPYLFAVLVSRRKGLFFRNVSAAFLMGSVIFVVLNPFSVLDGGFFLQELKTQSQSNTGTVFWHHLTYSLTGAAGAPMLYGFALPGFILTLCRPDRNRGLLAVWTVVYYAVLVLAGQPYDRYVLPLVPVLVFFAADFVVKVSGLFPGRLKGILFFLFIVSASAPSLMKSVIWDKVMTEKDVRTLAKEWAETTISPGTKIALGWEFFLPRLSFSKDQLLQKKKDLENQGAPASKIRRIEYLAMQSNLRVSFNLYFLAQGGGQDRFLFAKPVVPYDVEALLREGVEYVMLPKLFHDSWPREFEVQIREHADLIKVFTPYHDLLIQRPIDPNPLTGGPFLFQDLWNRERNGVPIEVYRLKGS